MGAGNKNPKINCNVGGLIVCPEFAGVSAICGLYEEQPHCFNQITGKNCLKNRSLQYIGAKSSQSFNNMTEPKEWDFNHTTTWDIQIIKIGVFAVNAKYPIIGNFFSVGVEKFALFKIFWISLILFPFVSDYDDKCKIDITQIGMKSCKPRKYLWSTTYLCVML